MRAQHKTNKNSVAAGSIEVRHAVHRAIHARPAGLTALLTTAALGFGIASVAHAGPQGGVVTSGQGSISTPNAGTTVIQQSSNVLGVDWKSFNVGAQERVQFNQPSSSSVAVNRILDQNPSQIFGRVDANGRVVLLNPNGIVFGRTAQLNVGSLVASSLKLANFDPASGRMSFDSDGTPGAVVNSGTINANAGSVALLGGRVTNDGFIVANYGSVALGAGKAATLDFTGDGLLQLQVTRSADANPDGAASAVANSGTITANGGTVLLTAQAAKDVFTNVVNNDGIVRAGRIENVGGEIRLVGTGGAVVNSGTLDASGVGSGSTGGTVQVLGDTVSLRGSAVVDVSGDAGGGSVRIGGDFHGANPAPFNATNTDVSAGTRIAADARVSGDAGGVVVWADGATSFDGTISAQAAAGKGGNAEVSGKQTLALTGHALLNGANGQNGTLLLDPGAITITHGNVSVNGPNTFSDAYIVAQLGSSDLTLDTNNPADATGGGTQNLTFDNNSVNITWANSNSLTLKAGNLLSTDATSVIHNTGSGGLTLTAGAGGMTLDGAITLSTGNLQATSGAGITGAGKFLIGGTATFAANTAGNISFTDATSDYGTVAVTSGNNVTLTDANQLNLGTVNLAGNLDVTATAGGITNTAGTGVTVGGTASFTANGGGQSIILDNPNNKFASTVSFAGGTLADITIVDKDTMPLSIPALTLSGNLNVTSTGGLTQGGPLEITGTTTVAADSNHNIDLSDTGNIFTGTVSVTAGHDVQLHNTIALELGSSNVSNLFNVTSDAGGITQFIGSSLIIGGKATFDAGAGGDDVTLLETGNDFATIAVARAGNAKFQDANSLSVGDMNAASGNVELHAGGAILGNGQTTGITAFDTLFDAAGDIGASGTPIKVATGNLNVTGGGNIYISHDSSFGFDAMNSTGAIGRVISVDTNGVMSLNGKFSGVANASITLNNLSTTTNVDYSAEIIGDGTSSVSVLAGKDLTMGAITASKAWSMTAGGAAGSTSGDLHLTGDVTATGSTITASAKNAVQSNGHTLTGSTLNVSGASVDNLTTAVSNLIANSGSTLTVSNTGALALGSVQTGSDLSLTSTGDLTQQGGQTVKVTSGTTTLRASNGSSILLGNSGNTFAGGTVDAQASTGNLNKLALNNTGGLAMAATTLTGDLTLTAGGPGITQTGVLNASGGTTQLSAANIDLSMANNFGTVQVTGGTAVTLHDVNAMTLGNTTATTLNVQTGGPLQGTGIINATTATLDAGVGHDITLNNSSNTLGTVTITQGANVTLNNNAAIAVETAAPVTQLNVTANGAITNTALGTISAGTAILNASTNDITMTAANNISTLAIGSAHDANIHNTGGLTVNASSLTGTLGLTAGGDITGSAAINAGGATLDAGAANINLTGPNSLGALSVAAANATVNNTSLISLGASTVTNALTVTTTGDITNSGAISAATTHFAAGNTHDITLTGNTNSLGTVQVDTARNVTLRSSTGVAMAASTISGALDVTASTGNISDSGVVSVTGATTLNAGAGTVTFNQAGTNLAGALNVTSSSAVTVVNASALNLGSINTTGALDATATTGGISNSGALSVAGTATFRTTAAGQSINVANAGNNFGGAVSFIGPNLANVSVTNTNAAAMDLAGMTLSGLLQVTANGVTQSGPLTVAGPVSIFAAGKDVTLLDPSNQFGSLAVTARNVNLQNSVSLNLAGTNVSGTLAVVNTGDITGSGGSVLVTGTTDLTPGATHDVTLNNANNDFVGAVTIHNGHNATLVDTNGLVLGDATLGGDLNATAGGSITAGGQLNITGNTVFTANGAGASITAINPLNVFTGTVAFAGAQLGNVSIADSTSLDLQSLTSVHLDVTAAGITDSGPLSIAGTTTLTAGTHDIVLDAVNHFGTVAVTSAHDVTLNDADGIDLGASTLSGALNVTANGDITDSGAITATSATFAAGSSHNIGINFPSHLGAASFTSANNVTLSTTTGLNVGASTISGGLDLTTQGDIVSSGDIAVHDRIILRPGGHNVTFGSAASDFQGEINVLSSGTVQLTSGTALSLGIVNATGDFSVTSGTGGITNSNGTGALAIGGNSTFTANGGGQSISLTNAANDFTGTVTFAGTALNSVAVVDHSPLDLKPLTLTGSLDVQAAGITQSGPLVVAGTTTLTAPLTASGLDNIVLTDTNNDFSTVAINLAQNVSLADKNALILGLTNTGGVLNVATLGDITQSGDISVGSMTLSPGAGNSVVLGRTNTNLGTVSVTSGKNVTLVSNNALGLGNINITGDLNTTAAGDILGSSGALTIAGNSSFTANAGGLPTTSINVGNTSNNFGGTVSFGGTGLTNVTVADSTALDLQGSTLAGNLTVTAAGITDSGALSIGGTTNLNAGTSDITLDTAANNFNVVTVGAARNVTLVDTNDIMLGNIAATGTTSITAGGAITRSNGAVVAANSLTLRGKSIGTATAAIGTAVTNLDAGTTAGDIYIAETDGLTLTASATGGTVNVSSAGPLTVNSVAGSSATLNSSGALTLGTLNVGSGAASLTASGAITDGTSGTSITAGALTMTAGSIGSSTNRLNTAVSSVNGTTTAGGLFVSNTGPLALTANATGGAVDVTNTSGAITVSTASGGGITLASAGGLTSGALNGGAGAVNLTSGAGGAMSLASVSGGTVTANSAGTLTASGAITSSGAVNLTSTGGAAMTLASVTGSGATINSGGALMFGSIDVGSGSATLTASGAILDGTSSASSIKGNALTLTGASVGASDNVLNTAATTLAVTANAGSAFVQDVDDVEITHASATGTLQFFAGSGTTNGTLTVGNLSANDGVLLVAGTNIRQTRGTLITAPKGELRAGVAPRGSGVTGQVGDLSAPITFGGTTTAVDLYLPVGSVTDPGTPLVAPVIDGPTNLKPLIHTFAGGGNAFFSVNFATIDARTLLGASNALVLKDQGFEQSASSAHGDAQILYVDWTAYDPSVSLFGTLTPALKLPADQREDEETGWVLPSGYTVVKTAQGEWRVVPVFRRRIAQIDTISSPLR